MIRMGFGFDDPSTQYHIWDGNFDGGENYHRKIKHKTERKQLLLLVRLKS